MINQQKIILTIKISMMKNFKLFLLSFVLIAGCLSSCSNNESVVEEQNIDETEAITTTLSRLAGQFDGQGNIIAASNPSGNIVFDFGFDFVYPLNLSFNNGTTVAVNNLDELISIIINSTENLYISGIEFPFDVEVYNEETDSIEVITINSEDEFFDLINDLDWDTQDSCDCFEDYSPVCVEINDPNGDSFVITYPNECYALCDGFTANDFVENCADDYNNAGGFECFELIFPVTIFTDENQTITVNSQSELDNALYNAYYFDFVYPFEVITGEGEIVTINSPEEIIVLLEDCYDIVTGPGDCDCPIDAIDPVCVQVENPNGLIELFVFPNACIAECEGFDSSDFVDCETNNPCDECENEEFIPVCVEVETETGEIEILVFPNACTALCEGYTENEIVNCEDINNPSGCTEEDVASLLVECQYWSVTISGQEYTYVFSNDGTVTVSLGNDTITSGTWNTESSPASEVVVNVNTTSGNFASVWLFFECDNPDGPEVVSTANWISEIESGCQ